MKLYVIFFIIKHNSPIYIYNIFTFVRLYFKEAIVFISLYISTVIMSHVTCLTVSKLCIA